MTEWNWTRKAAAELATSAMQLGLSPEDAQNAVYIGARMLVHGFTTGELDEMIQSQYQRWAEDERAVMDGVATARRASRYWERVNRD